MAAVTEKKKVSNTYKFNRVTDKKKIENYSNDPYFVKKNQEASDFLKNAEIPEDFKKKKK